MHHSLSSLEELELAYNNITSLPASYTLGNLQILSLAHNNINEWNEIEGILINLPKWVPETWYKYLAKCYALSLQTLKLNHNKIGRISYPTSNTANSRLKTLILSHNGIDNWKSIDALSLRFTQLESLSLTDCPLMSTREWCNMNFKDSNNFQLECDVGILRQSVIARFEKLETLNLSEVGLFFIMQFI